MVTMDLLDLIWWIDSAYTRGFREGSTRDAEVPDWKCLAPGFTHAWPWKDNYRFQTAADAVLGSRYATSLTTTPHRRFSTKTVNLI